MSAFSADWLALREPFDQAARAAAAAAFDWPALRSGRVGGAPLCVLDLACGTGANLRALALRLGGAQRWVLIDHDPALLAAVPAALTQWAGGQGLRLDGVAERLQLRGEGLHVDVECRCADIATGLDGLPFAESQLVTSSALLDLVAAPWLEALVGHCRAAGAAVLWALSVDSRIEWTPRDAQDDAVHELFGAHQRRDKDFGPALGSEAVDLAARLLADAGYRVTRAPSDWCLDGSGGGAQMALQRAMVEGIAAAALQQSPALSATIAGWKARRLARSGGTRLRVGHQDLFALLSRLTLGKLSKPFTSLEEGAL